MPKRMLDDSLLTSPSLAGCSPRAQDAFPRFILLADDFGCFDANPRVLLGRGWSLRPDVTNEEISGWLEEYRAAKPDPMVRLWTEGGRTYGFLLGWNGPHGQRRREEYSANNPKGSRRRTPAPPPFEAKAAEVLPATIPPGKSQIPPGQSSFPPLQSQSQSQSQFQAQVHLAGAVAPDGQPPCDICHIHACAVDSCACPAPNGAPPSPPSPPLPAPANVVQAPAQAVLDGVPEAPGVEDLRSAWNELTSPPIPRWAKMPKDRARAAKNAIARRPLEEWREVFRRIGASAFCRGATDRGSWVADVDWALRPAGVKPEPAAKVLDGKFDNPASRLEAEPVCESCGEYLCRVQLHGHYICDACRYSEAFEQAMPRRNEDGTWPTESEYESATSKWIESRRRQRGAA